MVSRPSVWKGGQSDESDGSAGKASRRRTAPAAAGGSFARSARRIGKPWETVGRKATGLMSESVPYGERRSKGAGALFAVRRRQSRADLATTMFAGLHKQTAGNCGTQSYGAKARQGYARRAAYSKPRETVGRKAIWGLNRRSPLKDGENRPRGYTTTTSQPGRRILCIREYCKERK